MLLPTACQALTSPVSPLCSAPATPLLVGGFSGYAPLSNLSSKDMLGGNFPRCLPASFAGDNFRGAIWLPEANYLERSALLSSPSPSPPFPHSQPIPSCYHSDRFVCFHSYQCYHGYHQLLHTVLHCMCHFSLGMPSGSTLYPHSS